MPRKSLKYTHCTIPDCLDFDGEPSPHYARGFCKSHYKMWQRDIDMHQVRRDSRYQQFSVCHRKPTKTGKPHEFGKQYCTKCEKPCYWRWDTID